MVVLNPSFNGSDHWYQEWLDEIEMPQENIIARCQQNRSVMVSIELYDVKEDDIKVKAIWDWEGRKEIETINRHDNGATVPDKVCKHPVFI